MFTATLILFAILYKFFLKRIHRAHFRWDANLLALAGLPLFSYLLLRSLHASKRGAVSWKGRTYTAANTAIDSNHARKGKGLRLAGRPKASVPALANTVEELAFRPALGRQNKSGL